MKAISLHNPHASLVALGKKQWETRPFRLRRPQRIAFASTKAPPIAIKYYNSIDEYRHALGGSLMADGHILCTADVTQFLTTAEWMKLFLRKKPLTKKAEAEYLFGDYGPSRFAWKLENVRVMDPPIPCRGSQGLWDVPGAALEAIERNQVF